MTVDTKAIVRLAVGMCAVFLFAACGDKSSPSAVCVPPSTNPANRLRIESEVPCSQATALNEAVATLATLQLDSSNPDVISMAKVMKTDDVSPAGLQSWMEDRVQYILKGDFDFKTHLYYSNRSFEYPNPSIMPDDRTGQPSLIATTASTASNIVMANMGTAVYAMGKRDGQLLTVNVPGIGYVSVTSPRTGILEIGPGMFPEWSQGVQESVINIFRIATLFHEARHSDGNGKSLGFMHFKCPPGHDYAGQYACDVGLNGAYTVGAMLFKNLMNTCTDCTPGSMATLRFLYRDVASRIIDPAKAPRGLSPQAPAGADWDDAPEGRR